MKTTILALAMSLTGGVAFAQTPPAAPPAPAAPAAKPQPPGAMSQPTPPQPGPQAQSGPAADPAGHGAPEGEIIETPQGFFIVRPGNAGAMQLPPPRFGSADQSGAMDDDETMDQMDQDRMAPPHPRKGPRRPPEGKGARFNIHAPNLDVRVKCPDDEPVKACVDAVSQLLDKASAQPH